MFGYVKGFYFHLIFIRQYYCVAKRQLSNTVFGNNGCVYFSLEDVLANGSLGDDVKNIIFVQYISFLCKEFANDWN